MLTNSQREAFARNYVSGPTAGNLVPQRRRAPRAVEDVVK
jgi:hypothetical protein